MNTAEVPDSLEGWTILHQMLRIRWGAWRQVAEADRTRMSGELSELLSAWDKIADGHSAPFSLVGHKGDLMLIHFRRDFDGLSQAELSLAKLPIWDFVETSTSYVSVIELGLYGDSLRVRKELEAKGVEPGTDEWKQAFLTMCEELTEKNTGRLFPKIPNRRYVSFYPMDKRRGEVKNWYNIPMAKRAGMMRDHGMIGRHYAGKVTQVISGSIGFDDWEWGVDLFARDPIVFKKLIYEMRFDEASSDYGLFGNFYLGLRFPAEDTGKFLEGELPAFQAGE